MKSESLKMVVSYANMTLLFPRVKYLKHSHEMQSKGLAKKAKRGVFFNLILLFFNLIVLCYLLKQRKKTKQ